MNFKSLIKETKQQLSPLAISLFNVAATTTSLIDQTKFCPWKKLMVYKTNSVFRCRQFYIQNGWTNCDPSERKRIIGIRFFVSKRASPCNPCYWTEFCIFFVKYVFIKKSASPSYFCHSVSRYTLYFLFLTNIIDPSCFSGGSYEWGASQCQLKVWLFVSLYSTPSRPSWKLS